MASPIAVAFAAQHENMTMTMDNMSSMGNMTGGGNATSMAGNIMETESLPSASETGACPPGYYLYDGIDCAPNKGPEEYMD